MDCPKCGFQQLDDAVECARCGVVFHKYLGDEPVSHPDIPPPPPPRAARKPTILTDAGPGVIPWRMLGIAALAAVVCSFVPVISWAMSALVTLFHEVGHAVVAWILGVPALPAFDFAYGGGFTHMSGFQIPLALLVLGLAVWGISRVRENHSAAIGLSMITLVWLILVTAEWRRETAISAAGAGGEIVFAGIFLYMAATGVGLRSPELERPLAAFAAFYANVQTLRFAWGLANDREFLELYRQGKGGALMNDLEVMALNLHIHTSFNPGIEGLARLLLVLAPLPLVIAIFLANRWIGRATRGE